jgi:hypothetical protein
MISKIKKTGVIFSKNIMKNLKIQKNDFVSGWDVEVYKNFYIFTRCLLGIIFVYLRN